MVSTLVTRIHNGHRILFLVSFRREVDDVAGTDFSKY